MSKTVLVISDQHAHPEHNNKRADWLGQFVKEAKPDVVVNIGDAADMASLSNFDKGKASFHGKNYENDINAHLDFQDRLWSPVKKAKKKQPRKVILYGNHEYRLSRVLEYHPEMAGDKYGISYKNYAFEDYYHDVIPYEGNTPGVFELDGVSFAHFFVSGLMGNSISGEHQAYSLISKNHSSCVVGHSHTADFAIRNTVSGKKIMGLVVGCYQDYIPDWCGQSGKLWWQGVVMLNHLEDGHFDPQFISLDYLRRTYGKK